MNDQEMDEARYEEHKAWEAEQEHQASESAKAIADAEADEQGTMPLSKEDRQEVERVRGLVAVEIVKWLMRKGIMTELPKDLAGNILRTIGSIPSKDQSLPDNEAWHKNEREFEAFCAGRNILISDNFQRLINVKGYEEGAKR